jgi:group I intron endonuclease
MSTYKPTAGVYKITNTVSGNYYIGSSKALQARWARHRTELRTGRHHSPQLLRAYARHGQDALKFEVLLECSVENLLMYEQILLDGLKPAYNSARTAGKVDHTPEVRAKLSAAAAARWADPKKRENYIRKAKAFGGSAAGKEVAKTRALRQWADEKYREKVTAVHRKRHAKYQAFGKLWCLKDAAQAYGVEYTILKNRVQLGWDLERALTTKRRGT